jgi:hypothetical protein
VEPDEGESPAFTEAEDDIGPERVGGRVDPEMDAADL